MSDDGYIITRTFAAPRELVFDMFTQPEHFSVWWGGDQVTVPLESIVLDAQPGGAWKATMVGDGWTINWVGEFLEVDRPSRLVIAFSDEPGPERDRFVITLEEAGDATELTLQQTGGHMDAAGYEQARQGTDGFLDVMQQLLGRLQHN